MLFMAVEKGKWEVGTGVGSMVVSPRRVEELRDRLKHVRETI